MRVPPLGAGTRAVRGVPVDGRRQHHPRGTGRIQTGAICPAHPPQASDTDPGDPEDRHPPVCGSDRTAEPGPALTRRHYSISMIDARALTATGTAASQDTPCGA